MIYLIKCNKTQTCKIGYSKNPEARLAQLQTGNPFDLELVVTMEGEVIDEKLLHEKFKHLKLQGEWFDYCEEIRNYFNITLSFWININLLSLFKNIGEVNIFEFILTDLDQRTMLFYHNKYKVELITQDFGLAESSQYRYLNNLIKAGVLERKGKGIYKVCDKWIEYGNENKKQTI